MRPRRRKATDVTEATAARIRAEHDLERHLSEAHRVSRVLEGWRRIRETNNIAEALEESFRGRHA